MSSIELSEELIHRLNQTAKLQQVTVQELIKTLLKQGNEKTITAEFLGSILANIPDAVIATDSAGQFVYICPNVQTIFGYSPEEVSKFVRISDFLGAAIMDKWRRVTRSEIKNFPYDIDDKSGNKRKLLINMKSISVGRAKLLFTCRDITELAETHSQEQKLQHEVNQRARQQESIAQFGLYALNHHDLDELINEAFSVASNILDIKYIKLFEFNQENETLFLKAGRGWKKGYVGTYRIGSDIDSLAYYTLNHNSPIVVENLASDDRFQGAHILHEHNIISSMTVIVDSNNHPYGVLCVHTDFPRHFTTNEIHFFQSIANVLGTAIERLQYEAQVEYQAKLLNNVNDAIIATDENFMIRAWNIAAENMYGWKTHEILGQHINKVIKSDFDNNQRKEALQTLMSGDLYTVELRQYHRNNTPIYIEGKTLPLQNDSGEITGYISVNRDISHHKQLQSHLNRRIIQAETSAKIAQEIANVGLDYQAVLDTIVSRISHIIGDMCVITELSDDKQWLVPIAYYHPNEKAYKTIRDIFNRSPQPVDSAIGKVVEKREPFMLSTMESSEADSIVIREYKSYLKVSGMYGVMIVPMITDDKVIGTLGVSRITTDKPYDQNDLKFLQMLASQVSVGVQNTKLYAELQINRNRLRELTKQIVYAQENERKRIARELHDEIGQALTVLKIQLERLNAVSYVPSIDSEILKLIELTSLTMESVHSLAENLRPPELDAVGLILTLQGLCEDLAKKTQLKIEYSGHYFGQLDDATEITLYRILQEALTNIIRHAQAQHVDVELYVEEGQVILIVQDDGVGLQQNRTTNTDKLGLIGMKERVDQLNGTMHIESEYTQFTRLTVRLPIGDIS